MAKRKSFEDILGEFVKKYQEDEIVDEKLKDKILEKATSWNKDTVMTELIRRIDEYRLYEDEIEFPYRSYLSKFMQEEPKSMIEEKDFS